MVLPATYTAALLLMILALAAQGSWANTFKLAGKWRFELYYWDFAIGAFAAAILAALTLGSLGFDNAASGFGFSFTDDLMRAGKRNMLFGFGAGVIFNLANMLLIAAVSVAGMSVAFPLSFGGALIVGAGWSYLARPAGSAALVFSGAAVTIAAMVLASVVYRASRLEQSKATIKAGKSKTVIPKSSWKGIILGLISGLLMGSFHPVIDLAAQSDIGLGPYALFFVFTAGLVSSAAIFNLFFMNLPVEGQPVEILEYFRGTLRQHALGFAGGVVWAAGALAYLVVSSTEARLEPALAAALAEGVAVVGALWGVVVWKEYGQAGGRAKLLTGLMLLLLAAGVVLVALGS